MIRIAVQLESNQKPSTAEAAINEHTTVWLASYFTPVVLNW